MSHRRPLISIVATVVVSSLAFTVVAQQPRDAGVPTRLRALGQAIQVYAAENKGYLPADLTLLKGHLPAEALEADQRDFIYLGAAGMRINRLKDVPYHPLAVSTPVVRSDVLCILYVDGHVEG